MQYRFLSEKLARGLDVMLVIWYNNSNVLIIFTALKELSVIRFFSERKRKLKVFKNLYGGYPELCGKPQRMSALRT